MTLIVVVLVPPAAALIVGAAVVTDAVGRDRIHRNVEKLAFAATAIARADPSRSPARPTVYVPCGLWPQSLPGAVIVYVTVAAGREPGHRRAVVHRDVRRAERARVDAGRRHRRT